MGNAINYEESREQAALIRWFDLQHPKLSALLVHVPNGINSGVKSGMRLKGLGLRSGVPDLVLFLPKHGHHGLFVEMKSKTGVVSPNQRFYLELLQDQGYSCHVAKGFEAAKSIIEQYIS
jgi:hypothetical protein